MKGFNIRKLATIAAGAALIGSAVAPIAAAALTDLTKSDVINATGAPVVDIVVGSHAAVSDVVWAGNIAAKLAQLATTTTAVTGGSGTGSATVDNISVKIAVGGTTSVTGGKTFFADLNSAAAASAETNFTDQNVTQSNIPSLTYYGSKSYTWNNTAYSTTMQEKLNFTARALYNSSTNKALVVTIMQGKLKYVADYGSGVPGAEALGSGTAFADDKNDNVIVPFFGKNYLLKSASKASGYVELVETNGEKDYKDGDKIEGIKDSNGNSYYIKVGPGGIDGTTNKVKLEIFDSTDTKLDGGYYSSGDVTFYKDGQTFLSTSVNISAILKSSVSSSDVYVATIYVGTARIQLYDSKGYPYDASKATDDYDYTVSLTWDSAVTADVNYLKTIEVVNSSRKVWNAATALKVGDSVSYSSNIGTLKVIGLELPGVAGASKTERTTGITVGNGKLVYKDSTYEATHSIPFATNLGVLSSGGSTTFTIDGKPFYAKLDFNSAGGAVLTIRKDSSTGALISTGGTQTWQDLNAIRSAGGTVSLQGASDVATTYSTILEKSSDSTDASVKLWLLLKAQTFTTQYTKKVTLVGTDINESGISDFHKLYVPNTSDFANGLASDYNALTFNTNTYHVAKFTIEEDGTTGADFNVFVDTGTGNLIALPNSQLSFYGEEVDYSQNTAGTAGEPASGTPNFKMSENTAASYPTDAYSDFGTRVTLANHILTVVIPEGQPEFELLLSGTGTTTTTTGGEELDVAKGATGTTTAGTTIEVKDVTYTATCGAGTGACTPASYEAIVPVGKLVYTDDSPPTGKVIIVGGHLVNALAQGITDDKLVAAGDVVAEKEANGDIVVAGYTAADTGAAAQELIDALDAMS